VLTDFYHFIEQSKAEKALADNRVACLHQQKLSRPLNTRKSYDAHQEEFKVLKYFHLNVNIWIKDLFLRAGA
jgi:hypothetical protein